MRKIVFPIATKSPERPAINARTCLETCMSWKQHLFDELLKKLLTRSRLVHMHVHALASVGLIMVLTW